MSKREFDEFIEKQSNLAQTSNTDWTRVLQEWQTYLEQFYATTASFLKPYIESGKIHITYGKKKILEDNIGEYEAKTAEISFGTNRIKLDPVGTNLVGAKGRVDLIGPTGKTRFVLVNSKASAPKISVRVWIHGEEPPVVEDRKPESITWAWKIATPPPNIRYLSLTDETFFDSLMEVSNG